ncbi:unnamed protein product [Adineta ricciae]|uniref:Integrator complex subunit 12 n=2 Tax=Adineta ricciae TaxID=249248 RepID=A0A815Q0D5_ADIRI|nr:unnamed protein product [Adineta ricciae]
MDLQPLRQLDYLQRTLSIFLASPSDMTEQFELLIDELIKENKQGVKSPKHSPEQISSDSKSEVLPASNSPQPLPKKRSAPLSANSKPPPTKRLKSVTTKDDDESLKKKKSQPEEKVITSTKDDDIYDDENSSDESKSKPSESQSNPSTSATRDMDEFAIELGLVCNKCMVLTEEKDNRLVECHECQAKYHQKCHKPPVSTADISDPRCLWYCSKCRKMINKRQQSQTSIKETKTNSNPSVSNIKSKPAESTLSTGKKGLSTSIADVTSSFFSFKPKSSESITSDSSANNHSTASNSTSSVTNGTTPKNANGWASLATGFKEKKSTPESSTSPLSTSAILADLNALTSSTNSNNIKRSPPSPKPTSTTSLNPLLKQPSNGNTSSLTSNNTTGSIKPTNSSLKPSVPSSPPVLKPQLSSSKSTQKLLPANKPLQRISSPTPIGRPTSLLKSPPSTTPPALNRLNSSGSNSSGSNSPSSTSANAKRATGLDYEKRLKLMKKRAAEKSLTKKF